MKTKLFVFALALSTVEFSAQAQVLELGARYWQMKPSGSAAVGVDGLEGTEIDIQDDLGYGQEEKVIGFDAKVGSGVELAVSHLALDLKARNRIERQIRFSDRTYRASADVESSLEAALWRLAFRFTTGGYGFRGGLQAGAQYVELEAALSARGYGSASEDANAALPVIGALLQFEPAPFFRLDAGIAGGAWDFGEINVTFWDAEANALILLRPFFVGAGYRQISIDGDETSIPLEADLTFKGFQILGGLAF
ncbi:MAG: hypothetical protein NZ740_05365 [Kiritimatiellae bacterium]|nr:hypothetical protein [Kiritimatiellia bacterium]MDW8458522.1 hypothetical protein [Verrucomicrobiota bacterium]